MSGPLLFGLHLKQIQKNRPQSNYIRPLKQFNELSISTKKARARTVAKKIKKDFNQIAKENYHPNDQVTLKELSYTVANTPFHVEFGSQNIIEKNKHESAIVQIIDKYQISRDGYRALSAIQPNLPRDYAVSDQRTILTSKMANYIPIETFNLYSQDNLLLNEEFQLVKKVARRSIKDILLYLHPYLVANKIIHSSKPVINLRISGDSHNVGKKINHVIITLAILDQKKELYLPDNHHTIVIYSDIEKYELLISATQPLVDELNELQQSGFVDKNGINWSINLYFSSDWKFLALCLGINMANSINFCPWCQCKKTDLGNLKKQSWTIEKDMNIIASNYLAYPGHIRAPLFPMIPLNHWVPDELHIMLRITDRLWSLIISELEQNGEYDNDMHETICNEMKKCKVKFEFWKTTTKWEYTSLLGPDKLIVLRNFDLSAILPANRAKKIRLLWNKFDQLYCAIKNPDIDFTQFALDAKEWEASFLQPDITNPNNQDIVEEGLYQPSDITPYIHVLVYHVPEFVKIHKEFGLSSFSCSAVEKKNHQQSTFFFRQTLKDGGNPNQNTCAIKEIMNYEN